MKASRCSTPGSFDFARDNDWPYRVLELVIGAGSFWSAFQLNEVR